MLEVTINDIVARIGTLEQLRVGDCLNDMQAAIHSIGGTVQGLGTAISQGRAIDRGIMECKAVINLIKISSDKSQFRMWDDKLINAYIQYAGPKVRQVFKLLAETADEGKLDEPTLESWSRVAAGEPKLEKEKFREDLYYILMDKGQDATAMTRIKAVREGDGIGAYGKLRKWFLGSSGMAITARTQLVMSPAEPKSEAAIADAIDKWREQMRVLEGLGPQYKLADPFKRTALRQLMMGKAKDHFDQLDPDNMTVEELITKCYDYATKKRLDSKKLGPDDMDVGELGEGAKHEHSHGCNHANEGLNYANHGTEQHGNYQDGSQDLDAFSKGRKG